MTPAFRPALRLFLLFSLTQWISCAVQAPRTIDEGVVEYEITYPQGSSQDNFMSAMMPTTMKLSFRNGLTRSDIGFGMGLMNASFISDSENKRLITLLQILDKKYALIMDSAQVAQELKSKKWKVTFSDERKKIAGFPCQKANVTLDGGPPLELYYTPDLLSPSPNWSTPFHEVEGVLLEYQLILNDMELKLKAVNVTAQPVDSLIFAVPDGYSIVPKEEMPEIFTQFFF